MLAPALTATEQDASAREPVADSSGPILLSSRTETMRKGDRLVLLTFDHEVHDQPGEVVLRALRGSWNPRGSSVVKPTKQRPKGVANRPRRSTMTGCRTSTVSPRCGPSLMRTSKSVT